jgi:hypothetical protein
MQTNVEDLGFLARLHAALASLQDTEDLIRQVRQFESFRSERRELRSAADLVSEAQGLVLTLLQEGVAR